MKKIIVFLFFLLGIVSFTYAQKWEFGVNAGLFRNGSVNRAEGSGGNFAGVWNVYSSFNNITNYKVGVFARKHFSKFYVATGASIDFNQQMDVVFENVYHNDPNYGENIFYSYPMQTISVPITGGVSLYKGFGLETGFIWEFDVAHRNVASADPEIRQYAGAVSRAFNKNYWRYTGGLFYQYKRIRASVDFQYDLGWVIHEIPYSYVDHNVEVHAVTDLFEKRYSISFTLSYSVFSK